MKCRHCNTELSKTFVDLGFAPPSNAYLSKKDLNRPEIYYPLVVKVCEKCLLVQTEDYSEASQLFTNEYAYFSSTSISWLEHAKNYVNEVIPKLGLTSDSFVIEIASNDGYLLKNFCALGIPCLGIEPTESTALESEKIGIQVIKKFFSESLAGDLLVDFKKPSLIIGNNVYPHVPDINDFTLGLKRLLAEDGIVTLEFQHLLRLMQFKQFDTIYHEHFSYLSLTVVKQIFESAGLKIWDVEELPTHGGSLRIYGCHNNNDQKIPSQAVTDILDEEDRFGLNQIKIYQEFQQHANDIKNQLLNFLIEKKEENKLVVAYGAAAKGNTILNYGGVKADLLPYVFDAASAKQDKYLPGCHIPILHPKLMKEMQPDYVLILPWNIVKEVVGQIRPNLRSDVQFVTAVPKLVMHD